MATTFEVDGVSYEIHFNINSEETFEDLRNKTMIDAVTGASNFIMVNDIKAFFVVGLYYSEGGRIPPAQINAIASKLIEDKGPVFFTLVIVEALERDCGFLLRAPESEDTVG